MDLASSNRTAEEMTRWKGGVVKSSVVPQGRAKGYGIDLTRRS